MSMGLRDILFVETLRGVGSGKQVQRQIKCRLMTFRHLVLATDLNVSHESDPWLLPHRTRKIQGKRAGSSGG